MRSAVAEVTLRHHKHALGVLVALSVAGRGKGAVGGDTANGTPPSYTHARLY